MPEGNAEDAPREEAKFNMAMLFYFNLNKLIEIKDAAYMNNDLEAWYKGLDRIYSKIVFKLKESEETDLNNLFITARNEIINKEPGASETLHKIDVKIVKLMNIYKMIFPKIDIKGGIEKLKERYGASTFD